MAKYANAAAPIRQMMLTEMSHRFFPSSVPKKDLLHSAWSMIAGTAIVKSILKLVVVTSVMRDA